MIYIDCKEFGPITGTPPRPHTVIASAKSKNKGCPEVKKDSLNGVLTQHKIPNSEMKVLEPT